MLNNITIMGRFVRDPELKRTTNDIAVTSFTLAVERDRKNQNGVKESDFIECVAWRGTAEFVSKYFTKGSAAIAIGRLQSRKWQDKDGNNRVVWEVIVSDIYFATARQSSGESAPAQTQTQNQGQGRPISPEIAGAFSEIFAESEGDLPF